MNNTSSESMPMIVEYLAIYRRTDSFCDSCDAFSRLIQVDSEIRIANGKIMFDKKPICCFLLSDGQVARKDQRYFHLQFIWDGSFDDPIAVKDFDTLLRKVRTIVRQSDGEIETLRNDIASHYACKAYPLINEIENLMRRLIANFMLITVGREWTTESLPRNVAEAAKKSNRKGNEEYLNLLFNLDFIHLGQILFEPYSNKGPDLSSRLKSMILAGDITAFSDYVPESNWNRYFASIVDWEDGQLKTRWERLYTLRCLVAHNNFITSNDLKEIQSLVGEVKPKLDEAIQKLSKVQVPPEQLDRVAESAARSANELIGHFMETWNRLESAIASCLQLNEKRQWRSYSTKIRAEILHKKGILDDTQFETYLETHSDRNQIVHNLDADFTPDEIQHSIRQIKELTDAIEAHLE